jgi:hypothetical protein
MANPKIEVEIGAVIDGLRKGFGESVKIIETLEKQALDLDKALKAATDLPEIQSLNSRLAQTKAALSQLKTAGIDPLTKATSQYNSVGIDFARIVQDAPFGIIGVGNNITQLAGSFQVLKNETGSTSGALKKAFSQIFSSGNALILGISLLTTAFTILQQKGFFKSEQDAKSLDEALKEYQETLTGVSAATLKGAQDSQKELSTLKALELQATNTSLSTKQRTDAVNELQKLYPEYFANLTQEQIKNGDVGEAYTKVTANILAKAKAQASTNAIAQNSIDLLRIETKLEEQKSKRLLETSSAQAQVDALIEKRQKEGFLTQGDLQRYETLIKSINTANKSLVEEQTLKSEISRINKENEQLTSEITKQLELGGNIVNQTVAKSKEINIEKEKELKFEDQNIVNLEFANQLRNEALKKIGQISSNVDRLTAKKVSIELDGTPIDGILAGLNSILVNTPSVVAALENIGKVKVDLSTFIPTDIKPDEVKKSFSPLFDIVDELTSSFGGLGSIIGSVFGNNQKLGQFIAQFVGFAAKLIAANFKIASSNAIAGASQAAAATGPAAPITLPAFIAGSLAVVAGAFAAFGGGGRKSSSVGSSGVGAGSSFVGGGAQGGLFAQNNNLTGEFVVRGTDLVYVLGQANNKINKG